MARRGKLLLGSFLVGIVLFLNALASSHSLHEWFHHDADSEDHQCAVTMFAHGQIDSAIVDILISTPLVFVASSPLVKFSIFAPAIENLPAGRAPPVLPAVS